MITIIREVSTLHLIKVMKQSSMDLVQKSNNTQKLVICLVKLRSFRHVVTGKLQGCHEVSGRHNHVYLSTQQDEFL